MQITFSYHLVIRMGYLRHNTDVGTLQIPMNSPEKRTKIKSYIWYTHRYLQVLTGNLQDYLQFYFKLIPASAGVPTTCRDTHVMP